MLVVNEAGAERRIYTASIRVPRQGGRGREDEPFAWHSKEFLRKKLIGQKIRIIVAYKRDEREFCDIFCGSASVGKELLRAGYAEVQKHRIEEERSAQYAEYMVIEAEAASKKIGKWSKEKNAGVVRITDLTIRGPRRTRGGDDGEQPAYDQSASKARQYLPFLQRAKNVDAIVEYVFGADRLKLYIPKEKIMVSFVLGGIRAPNSKEPIGAIAKEYVATMLTQRNVRIEVETSDRGDNFIGSVFMEGNVNLAVKLLSLGYAMTHAFSADKSPHSKALYAAEAPMKEARGVGTVWENWVEPEAEENADGDVNEAKEEAAAIAAGEQELCITEIINAVTFYVTYPKSKRHLALEEKIGAVEHADEQPDDFEAHKGLICAGFYSDGNFYRVKLLSVDDDDDDNWNVFFLDYGNSDVIAGDMLRPLPEDIQKAKALAQECVLAGCKTPSALSEYAEDAAHALNDMTGGDLELTGKVECMDKQRKQHMVLTAKGATTSINAQIIRDGWVRVLDGKACERGLKSFCASLQADEQQAISNRLNIWEYGDVSDSEEEEGDYNPRSAKNDGRPPSKKQMLAEKAALAERAAALKKARSN
jgi:staphylococcal nuclease domain-containing protein 1